MKLKTPEEAVISLKNYFTKDRKFVLLLTIILGILAHFLIISKLILSQDGLLNGIHYTSGLYEYGLGRWGIDFFDSLRNNIAFPFITTIISIIIMGFINILLIDLFEFKSRISKFFTIASVVLSPCLCMTLLYAYTADAYVFAMLFSVFSAYCLYKFKNKKLGCVLSIFSFVIMLSLYQSYMGITIGLILIIEIKRLLSDENFKVVDAIKSIFSKAVILVVSALIYFVLTMIILRINNTTLSTYKGANQISVFTIITSLIPSIKTAYLAFIKYFFADGIILNREWRREKLYLVFFIIIVISVFLVFVKIFKNSSNKRKSIGKIVFSTVLMIVLPIGLNIIALIAPGNEIYFLIATQMFLVIPFVLMICEILSIQNVFENILNWLLIVVLAIIMITYLFSIIVTYQTAEFEFNQAKSVTNRILDRMENTPGYRSGMNKLFAGVIDDINFPKTLDIYNYGVTNSLRASIFHGTYWGQQSTWRNFIEIFCGIKINFCSDEEYAEIVKSDEFKEMDIFPGQNSVKIINDVMVVKFTDAPAEL